MKELNGSTVMPQSFYAVIEGGKAVMLPAEDGQWLNKTTVAESFQELEQRAEAAEAKLAVLEKLNESRWSLHDGIARPIGLNKDDLVYLKMKRQEIKLPYPAGMVNWKHDGGEFDVIAWASVNAPVRPAPAVSLAELVLDENDNPEGFIAWYERQFAMYPYKGSSHVADCEEAWRAAILRNIEEQSL